MRRQRQRRYGLETVRLGAGFERRARPPLGPDERVTRRERRARYRIGLAVIAVGLIASMLWRLFTPITRIEVKADDPASVEQAVAAALAETSRLNILIDAERLEETVTRAVPDAVDTEVEHSLWLSRLTIRVGTQKPALRWQSRGVQYVVSDYGFALAAAGEQDKALPLIFDDSGVEVELKSQIVPPSFAAFIADLDKAAGERHLKIRERYVSAGIRELRFILEGRPYGVRVSTTRTAAEQISELIDLEAYFEASGRRAREYVDLRIPGRAYWK
jgi:hypothetical protein